MTADFEFASGTHEHARHFDVMSVPGGAMAETDGHDGHDHEAEDHAVETAEEADDHDGHEHGENRGQAAKKGILPDGSFSPASVSCVKKHLEFSKVPRPLVLRIALPLVGTAGKTCAGPSFQIVYKSNRGSFPVIPFCCMCGFLAILLIEVHTTPRLSTSSSTLPRLAYF